MANIAVQSISKVAVKPTFTAVTATTGDTVANGNDDTLIYIKNGNAGSVTVAADAVTTCDEGFEHDLSVSIPAGEEKIIPLTAWITDGSTGLVTLICTPAANVTMAAIRKA